MNHASDELLAAIAELRGLFPDWRMGQLMANLVQAAELEHDSAMWNIEDEQMLSAARRLIDRNQSRRHVEIA